MSTTRTSPQHASNMIDLLRLRAASEPNTRIYTFLLDDTGAEATLNYEQLDRQARAIAAYLQSVGAHNRRVMLLYPPGLEYISAFFGCLYAGALPVPAYPPKSNHSLSRLQAIVHDAEPLLALTASTASFPQSASLPKLSSLSSMRWLPTDTISETLADEWQEIRVDADSLAFLQYTSGSTASPKGVMLTHKNLLHNLEQIRRCFEHTENSQGVIWLPPYHDMGLIGGILQPLYVGFPVTLMSPVRFIQQPLRWLQAISRTRGTTSGAPNFAYELCVRRIKSDHTTPMDLSSWDVAFCGAEPIRRETLVRFTEAFEPYGFKGAAFYPCYGLAEATLIVAGGRKASRPLYRHFQRAALEQNRAIEIDESSEGGCTLVSCGSPLPDQRILIADPTMRTISHPNEVGEILLSGPSIAQGYWNRYEETESTFQAHILPSGDGPYLRTGDLGFLYDNELFVTGRMKDMIIIRGRNHYPQDIEMTAENSHVAMQPGGNAAFSVEINHQEQLVILQEVKREYRNQDAASLTNAVRQSIAAAHEIRAYTVVLVKQGSLPKTSSGKIQRSACRHAYLNSLLKAIKVDSLSEYHLDEWSENITRQIVTESSPSEQRSMLQRYLQERLSRRLGLRPHEIDCQGNIATIGIDSLAAAEIQHIVETDLAVHLPLTTFLRDVSVAEIADEILVQLHQIIRNPVEAPVETQKQSLTYHLSRGQRGIWFQQQLVPACALYNIAKAFRVHGWLDVANMQNAFQALTSRHGALRTIFRVHNGEPSQHILSYSQFQICEEDASTWTDDRLSDRLHADAMRPFDLEEAPPIRLYVYSRGERETILLLSLHHLIADFWSLEVLVNELLLIYTAHSQHSLKPLPQQYGDYVLWESRLLAGPEGEHLRTYWQEQLQGPLSTLDLPFDHIRPDFPTYSGDTFLFEIDRSDTKALSDLSRAHGATLYMTLLAAFQLLLHRYSGQNDILVGTPLACRTHSTFSDIIGCFANHIVMRTRFSLNGSFSDVLNKVRETVLSAIDHQHHPFSSLVEDLQLVRDISRNPIFQAQFVLYREHQSHKGKLTSLALAATDIRLEIGDIQLEPITLRQRTSQFDLTLAIAEMNGSLNASIEYSVDLFKAETIERMASHFVTLIHSVTCYPKQALRDLQILRQEELQLLLETGKGDVKDYAQDLYTPQLIALQVPLIPDAVAAVFGDLQLTYRELNRRAGQLADYFQTLGVGPEVIVGVCMDRSMEMVIGLLAIVTAGGAYLPLDPAHPQDRLKFIVNDAGAKLILTQAHLQHRFSAEGIPIVCLDRDWNSNGAQPERRFPVDISKDNLAYVIYTSGSTGMPKGAMNTHGGIRNRLLWMQDKYQLGATDRVLHKTPFGFDVSVWEIFLPLIVGARLVLARPDGHRDPAYLTQLICEEAITLLHFVPSMLRYFLSQPDVGRCRGIRRVICSGEALSYELQERFKNLLDSELHNLYGPTEASVEVTSWNCIVEPTRQNVPIGRPIANVEILILDRYYQAVPAGVSGELCIAGIALARGYANRPDLTAERFFPHPLSKEPGARTYRSGDLARYRADNVIEYLGRLDQQVKIHGIRIELEEIRRVLLIHPDVKDAVVQARTAGADDHNAQLCAYVVAADELQPSFDSLRGFLQTKLPDYMLPTHFVFLQSLPISLNGKIDYKALPKPDGHRPDLRSSYVAAATQEEREIAALWKEVLGLDHVGIHDNFFDLGGDSILALRLVSRLRDMALDLSLRDIYHNQTIALQARVVKADAQHSRVIPASMSGRLMLTPIQTWFFEQNEKDPNQYNQVVILRLSQDVRSDLLSIALHRLVEQHDALRMRISERGPQWLQYQDEVDGSYADLLEIITIPSTGKCDVAEFLQSARNRILQNLTLFSRPLFRAALLNAGPNGNFLLLVCHHLVVDGVSWHIVISDLLKAYEQAAAGSVPRLVRKTTSFVEWSHKLYAYAQSDDVRRDMQYWHTLVSQLPSYFPIDHDLGDNTVDSSDIISGDLGGRLTESFLGNIRPGQHLRTSDLLLSALFRTLQFWLGQDSVAISLEAHGREDIFDDVDLSQTVGWFTSLFPVALEIDRRRSLTDYIRYIKGYMSHVPKNGLSFGLLRHLVENEELRRCLGDPPLPSVCFNYLGHINQGSSDFNLTSDAWALVRDPEHVREFLIEVIFHISNGHLRFDVIYSRHKHSAQRMRDLVNQLSMHLTELFNVCLDPVEHVFVPSDFPLVEVSQESLDRIIEGVDASGGSIDRVVESILPLSPIQQGMLFHSLGDPASPVSHEQFSFIWRGNLDENNFKRAWEYVIDKVQALRVVFNWHDLQNPVQIIISNCDVPIEFHDVRSVARELRDELIEGISISPKHNNFDLMRGPLYRISIFQLDDAEFFCVWSFHHIILDGWSVSLLFGYVLQTYRAFIGGGNLPRLFEQPLEYYFAWLARQDREQALSYWLSTLRGVAAPTPLPLENYKRVVGHVRTAQQEMVLAAPFTKSLRIFARRFRVTLSVVMQAVWAMLLRLISGDVDVVFGVTTSGRPDRLEGSSQMIGLFIRNLPMRVAVGDDRTFVEVLEDVREQAVGMADFGYLSLSDIQSCCSVHVTERLFDSLLIFQNYPLPELGSNGEDGFAIVNVEAREMTAYRLTVTIFDEPEMRIRLQYDCKSIDDRIANALLAAMKMLLIGAMHDPWTGLKNVVSMKGLEALSELQPADGQAFEALSARYSRVLLDSGIPRTPDRVFLLDAALRPVLVGVKGEIYLGWASSAKAVEGGSAMTYQEVIADLVDWKEGTLYRTGDRGRLRASGDIEWLGDGQRRVYLQGHWVYLAEVECAVNSYSGVTACAVQARNDASGSATLMAYYTASVLVGADELHRHIQEIVPNYMIPDDLIQVRTIVIESDGSVSPEKGDLNFASPLSDLPIGVKTEMEELVCSVFREVLNVSQIRLDDGFFDLGGHSLGLVRAHERLQTMLGRTFPIVEMFKYATVRSLAAFLEMGTPTAVGPDHVQERARRQRQFLYRQSRRINETSDRRKE